MCIRDRVNGRPQLLPMRDLVKHFVNHRHDVVVRRARFDLKKAEERLHIVQGLLIAQDNICLLYTSRCV